MTGRDLAERARSTNERKVSVVMNQEGQYSIWPAHKELPAGWHSGGFLGSKAECLAYIDTVWKDMRPRSTFTSM
jgi:MbtH protein